MTQKQEGPIGTEIAAGPSLAHGDDRSVSRTVSEMSKPEMVAEARHLHNDFQQLAERYEQGSAHRQTEIRLEMEPVVKREHELRQEYTSRIYQEERIDHSVRGPVAEYVDRQNARNEYAAVVGEWQAGFKEDVLVRTAREQGVSPKYTNVWIAEGLREERGYELTNPERRAPEPRVNAPWVMSKEDIVSEARSLHENFQQLAERYEQAPKLEREDIREKLAPLVERERALRQEFTERATWEIGRDRAPVEQMSLQR